MILVFTCLTLLAYVLYGIYNILCSKLNYWKIRDVPHKKPVPIFGNYADYITLKKYSGYVSQKLCEQFSTAPYFGTFYGSEPALVIQDPELIKLVLTKDFYYFSGREGNDYSNKETVTKNMFFSGGDHWKVVRQNMTPLFSSAKMKNMFYLIEKCAHSLEDTLDEDPSLTNEMEIKLLMTKYTIGCIGSCIFGLDTKSLEKTNEENPFVMIGNLILGNNTYRGLKLIARAMWPAWFYRAGFKMFPSKLDTFFHNLLVGIFKGRGYKPTSRNDFVDFILGFKKDEYISGDSLDKFKGEGKKVQIVIDDELLVAQFVLLFGAGFETSASTLSFTMYELAKNQDAQRRAQEEVDQFMIRHNNKLSYEGLHELPYLEACIEEAMRLYPVLGILTREVIDNYVLPSGLLLEKGMRVHIPTYALHRNPQHFPEPNRYIPERFLPENKANIKPYTYIPFGEGPRTCLGSRFAKMQMMPGLITVLKSFNLELAPGTASEITLEPRTVVAQPINGEGITLKMTLREGSDTRRFDRSAGVL